MPKIRSTSGCPSFVAGRQILLQDITPNDVLVTPRWSTLLRPNYVHAREGRPWTTAVSIRDPPPHAARSTAALQHVSPSRRMSLSSDEEPLVAPFSDATRQDYQASSKRCKYKWRCEGILAQGRHKTLDQRSVVELGCTTTLQRT